MDLILIFVVIFVFFAAMVLWLNTKETPKEFPTEEYTPTPPETNPGGGGSPGRDNENVRLSFAAPLNLDDQTEVKAKSVRKPRSKKST